MEQSFEDKLWDIETSRMAKGHQIIIDQEKFEWLVAKVKDLYEVLSCYEDDLQQEKEYNEAISETCILNGNLVVKYEEALREIDTHIRATSEPVPYIIKTLKKTLPEYND